MGLAVPSLIAGGTVQLVDSGTGVADAQVHRCAQAVLLLQPVGQVELEPMADRFEGPHLAGRRLAAIAAALVAGLSVRLSRGLPIRLAVVLSMAVGAVAVLAITVIGNRRRFGILLPVQFILHRLFAGDKGVLDLAMKGLQVGVQQRRVSFVLDVATCAETAVVGQAGCISPIALVLVWGRKVNRRMDGNFVGWAWSWVEWEAQ